MKRRNFISSGLAAAASSAAMRGADSDRFSVGTGLPKLGFMPNIRWQKAIDSEFYTQAIRSGAPLVYRGAFGLLTASWSVQTTLERPRRLGLKGGSATFGGLSGVFRHRLLKAGQGSGEDVLEAEFTLRNESGKELSAELEFASSARPYAFHDQVHVHFPLTAAGLEAPGPGLAPPEWAKNAIARDQFQDCEQIAVDNEETGRPLIAHYLEPTESDLNVSVSKAPLLIPLIDLGNPQIDCRIALFCSPLRGWRIGNEGGGWSFRTRLTFAPGEKVVEKCWMYVHRGGPSEAWRAFHTLAHQNAFPRISWVDEAVLHFWDYLSPGLRGGKRGPGFYEDAREFQAFHVGLATVHGYFAFYGDYIDPDRKTWLAMVSDSAGAVPISIDDLRARIRAARAGGSRMGIYMHQAAFDSGSSLAKKLRDGVVIDKEGKLTQQSWHGPETVGPMWLMSIASPIWREHFLRQAQWIMELLQPDALVVDESFYGFGYDYRSSHSPGISRHMIPFQQQLRQLVRSFGDDKALFTSDCGWTSFVLWADGDSGDHENIWREEYRKSPVRYLAALGDHRWLPCLWRGVEWWDFQMDLARKTGAGVSLSNGWIEYSGLTALPPATRAKLLGGIKELKGWRSSQPR